MAYKNPESTYTSGVMDCTVSASYSIFKNNSNKIFLPNLCFFSLINVSGYISDPVLSVGYNSPVFSNFILPTTLTTLGSLNSVFPVIPSYVFFLVTPGEELKMLVNTAASATSFQIRTTITGSYF